MERIIKASATGGQVEMPLYITESGYYFEDLPLLEEVVVASYTTYFNRADLGRNKNIELSARAINNAIVGSGDYFSLIQLWDRETKQMAISLHLKLLIRR